MKTVALTGSIGSGKTTVLKFVRKCRVPAIDCDSVVSNLYRDKRVQKKLIGLFGTKNRKDIASIIFSSPSKRKRLESFLHPLVWKQVNGKLSCFRKQGKALVVVDVPLLFEARWQNRFDLIIFVKAPKKKCLERIAKRGLSKKEGLKRWHAQLPPMKKVKSSHYIIDNSGSLAKAERQVRQLLAELLSAK